MRNSKDLYQHGGNIYEIQPQRRGPLLDFSANINPLGIPGRTKQLLSRQVEALVYYPDPAAKALTIRIARYWKVKPENILVGNGSTELIYLILNAFKPATVTLTAPCFSEYERAAILAGCRIRFIPLTEDKDFCFNYQRIKRSDMLFLCNPNNPTGNLLISDPGEVKNIPVRRIVVDEAFMDFVPAEDAHTFIPQATKSRKFICLRTLTKLFALPGLRMGYVVAHSEIIRDLKKYQIPWSVNVLAQAAATHCLSEVAFIRRSRQLIEKERRFLYERLSRMRGLKPYPSATNFLLVKIRQKGLTSLSLKQCLLKKGILIRDCANFRGLDGQFIRVAVRSHKENLCLIQALEKCV